MAESPPFASTGFLRRSPWLWTILIWGLLLAGLLPLRTAELIAGDEGIELTKAWHWFREGHWDPAYWNDQPLTHTRVFALLFHLDPSPLGPRLWSVGMSMLLLGAVASLTHTLFQDRAAGLTAATLVAVGPQTLHLSVSAVQEVPALALGAGAVALAWHPMTRRHPMLLGLSLLLVISGMAIKLTAGIYAAAAALGLVFHPSRPHPLAPVPRRLLLGSGYLAAAGLGVLLLLGAVDGRSTTEWLGSHWAAQQAAMDTSNPSHGSPWRTLIQYYPALALGSLSGLVVTVLTCRRSSQSWDPRLVIWAAVGVGFNAAIRPWWMYYSLSLWIALAPLAGLGFCQGLRSLTRLSSTHRPSFTDPLGFATAAFAAWIAMACLGWWTVSAFFQDFQQLRKCRPGRDHPVVRLLHASRPTDREATVFSRESIWAFWSQLRTPGPLLVVTHKRFLSGDLDDQRLVTLVLEAAPDFLVSAPGWDPGKIPEWEPVLRHYQPARNTEGRVIYAHHRIGTLASEERLRW
jgi:hypothetical protein